MTQEFVVDQPYFRVTYEKALYPVVITFNYLGKNLRGEPVDPSDPEFFFRFIPAFQKFFQPEVLPVVARRHQSGPG